MILIPKSSNELLLLLDTNNMFSYAKRSKKYVTLFGSFEFDVPLKKKMPIKDIYKKLAERI